eukprot:TRINITY_DN26010_c0_g1_i1.p1 TRINITY_DN26010_c0_g1~~TRINITY_DN26010_c0_g1_i1.p1  ORF type:complete len:261 (+),score=42.01 TRINITY_DN26010_c0_g1_i1:175-957(+)
MPENWFRPRPYGHPASTPWQHEILREWGYYRTAVCPPEERRELSVLYVASHGRSDMDSTVDRIRTLLKARGVAYKEVQLCDPYTEEPLPHVRREMEQLSGGEVETPQLFLRGCLIGAGRAAYEELQFLVDQHQDLDRTVPEMAGTAREQPQVFVEEAWRIPETMGRPIADRVYQCVAGNVDYTNSPRIGDKSAKSGPTASMCFVATRIYEGPGCAFLQCKTGNGWLPLVDPEAPEVPLFEDLGRLAEVEESCMHLSLIHI